MKKEFEIGTAFNIFVSQSQIDYAEQENTIPTRGILFRENEFGEDEGYYMCFLMEDHMWGGVLLLPIGSWDKIEKSKYDALMSISTYKIIIGEEKLELEKK